MGDETQHTLGHDFHKDSSKVSFNKRGCYFLVFIAIALPVVVGVVVWHLTDRACNGSSEDGTGGNQAPVVGTSVGSTVQVTTAGPSTTEPWKYLRLSGDVKPVHYEITLYPDFYDDNGWFYGNETAELNVIKSTKFILIHTNHMNVTHTELNYSDGTNIPLARTWWYAENQFWVVEAEDAVRTGTVFLRLRFDGSLTQAIVGFYKSSYTNSMTGERRHLASSKFQPVDARRAFPCMDEPGLKAEYTVTLVHQPGYIALSNMPAMTTSPWEHNNSLLATPFKRSVPMSTYLVCFVVCDFANITSTTKYGNEIRVFATPDRIQQAEFSLKVMKMSMELYQDLFKVEFPLPKNDMIGIPNFVSGAMEHWGLITYREVNMLYDPLQASAANQQRVAVVVAHEIAHMWFGNIVTMDWWDDLWLNEGFASFVEYLGANVSEPAWEMLDQMVVEDVKPVMVTDAGVNSHPIVVDVNHPDQINEVFDAISYSKGASILRMLQEILGGEAFFNGISAYLKKYEWSTATTDQLWDELGQVRGGYSVKEVMDTWTLQMGLPYINISTTPGSGGITNVMASQHRFLAHKSLAYDPNESPFRYKWFVNLDYMDGNKYKTQWITKDQDSVTFSVSQTQPVKFNVKDTGFYRVNYPDTVWRDFAQRLNQDGPNAIPEPADRTGLIDDSFNLARGGYLSYDVALEMTSYLDRELHHLPWDSAFNGITYIKDMFLNSGMFNTLRKYILTKVRPVLDKITWNDEQSSHLEKLMRSNLIQLACDFSDTDCYDNATQRFRDFVDRNISIPPNLRLHVYKYGMSADGSEADWEFLWQRFLVETVPQERVNLMYGLSFTKHVWLLNRYLDYCKDPTKILSQDFFAVVTYISRNPVGNSLAWDWVRNNWEYLVTRFTTGSRSLGRLVPSIVDKYNSQFKLLEVEDFFVKYPDGGAGSRGRDQARESIQRNIIWMRDNSGNIKDWLENNLADA